MGAYDIHNATCSSKERTRRTQWACLKPSESFRLSVHLSDSHASSVCVHFFSTETKRLPAARLWQSWAVKLPEPCAQHCHGNRELQDWLTHTHTHTGKTYSLSLCLFTRHTHSHRHPAAEGCNRNTEEPAWADEKLHNTERTHDRGREAGRHVETHFTITRCTVHSQERAKVVTSIEKLSSIWLCWKISLKNIHPSYILFCRTVN